MSVIRSQNQRELTSARPRPLTRAVKYVAVPNTSTSLVHVVKWYFFSDVFWGIGGTGSGASETWTPKA